MSNLQELILATSSSNPYTQKAPSKRPTFAPSAASSIANTQANGGAGPSSITLHDLNTSAYVHSFKPSNSGVNSVGVIQSRNGEGGGLLISQEGKALLSFWAWQKVRRACQYSLEQCNDAPPGPAPNEDSPPREAFMLRNIFRRGLGRRRQPLRPHLPLGGKSTLKLPFRVPAQTQRRSHPGPSSPHLTLTTAPSRHSLSPRAPRSSSRPPKTRRLPRGPSPDSSTCPPT